MKSVFIDVKIPKLEQIFEHSSWSHPISALDIQYICVIDHFGKREIFCVSMGLVFMTEQAWSILDLLYGQKIRFCGNKTGNPEQAKLAHLARSGNQSEHSIRFVLPARGASHKIRFIPAFSENQCAW